LNEYQYRNVMDRLDTILSRLTALESRQCSDSHAPSSAGSGGTTLSPSTETGAGSSATPSPLKSADAATGSSDSARRALADNNRPKWLTREAAASLPEGTERVYKCSRSEGDFRAYPGRHFLFTSASMDWSGPNAACDEAGCIKDMDEVYHLPLAAKVEGDAWSRWKKIRQDTDPNDWDDAFNAFVAGECERAVRDHVAGAGKMAPRPSPGEVAEGIVNDYEKWIGHFPGGRESLRASIEAAIVRERNRP